MSNEVSNTTLMSITARFEAQDRTIAALERRVAEQARQIVKLQAEAIIQKEFEVEATRVHESFADDLWGEEGAAVVASCGLDIAKEAMKLARAAHNREQYTRDCVSAVHEHVANLTAALDSKGLVDAGEVTVALPGTQPTYAERRELKTSLQRTPEALPRRISRGTYSSPSEPGSYVRQADSLPIQHGSKTPN